MTVEDILSAATSLSGKIIFEWNKELKRPMIKVIADTWDGYGARYGKVIGDHRDEHNNEKLEQILQFCIQHCRQAVLRHYELVDHWTREPKNERLH